MKIGIPVNDKSIDKGVCMSFGRAPYFLIYDTDSREEEFIENSAIKSQGGAGILAAQSLVNSKVDALITPRCGENAASVIRAGNIKIYKTIDDSIEKNIEAFEKGDLKSLDEIQPGFHNHGGK